MDENLCPECGAKMTPKKNSSSGQYFWGCTRYPDCRGTRDTDGEAPSTDSLPSERQRTNDRYRFRRS